MRKKIIVLILIMFLVAFVFPILGLMNCTGWYDGNVSCFVDGRIIREYSKLYFSFLIISCYLLFIPIMMYISSVVGLTIVIYELILKKKYKKVLWKVYFGIILIDVFLAIILMGASIVYPRLWVGVSKLWGSIDLVFLLIAVLGLFAFIWEKNIFSKLFWKIFLPINIVWNILCMYVLSLPDDTVMSIWSSQFFISTGSLVLYIPLFFALYFYAFNSSKLSKK